jgi:transposase
MIGVRKGDLIEKVGSQRGRRSDILQELQIPRSTFYRWREAYEKEGIAGLEGFLRERMQRVAKADDEAIKAAVFSMIHSPPSEHNINRTSWKLEDICRCLLQQDIHVSKNLVSKIIKGAGYSWRKAKTVLTSNDPEYRQKLDRIKSILSTLGENDRFCSIDEFGPFAVKVKGGKRLVGPNEYPQVPQFQKSKGCLIVTAALELSQNQVTHFYSKAKNTTEMIKLLEVLLEKYKGCDGLYFSWDAASWHASKALCEKVKSINLPDYREMALTSFVELAPLPKSAQFLNVIGSVFSGMARAIIHNSDYKSVEEAVMAIDRYFQERNEHFLNHPKKAGKKIWGNEPSVSEFSEWNNCKDPRWR